MADPIHSTGRGGAGNIGEDPQVYTDGAIIREGEGQGTTGRGGFGNTASPALKPSDPATDPSSKPLSKPEIMVPDVSTTTQHQSDFHTGRGGKGNVHKDKYGGHSTKAEQEAAEQGNEGIMGKVKKMLGMQKKDKGKGKEGEAS